MTSDPPAPEDSMNTLILRFLEDTDDAHQERESEALLVNAVPRRGEVIVIDHQFHAVANVIHNYDADGIEVHLGPSSESAEQAQEWLAKQDSTETEQTEKKEA